MEAYCPEVRLAYITPSCEYPVGSTLVLERRLLLVDWAERAGAFVIEDGYDSEYRYGSLRQFSIPMAGGLGRDRREDFTAWVVGRPTRLVEWRHHGQ